MSKERIHLAATIALMLATLAATMRVGIVVALGMPADQPESGFQLFAVVEEADRAKSGPSQGQIERHGPQMKPPAIVMAGGANEAERGGFEPP